MTKFTTASGEVLTDEDIEALADEAERGYDLDKAIKVTVGRPSLGAKGASPRVQIRVDPISPRLCVPVPARSIAPSARSPAPRYAST
jgi:hypothetical protein